MFTLTADPKLNKARTDVSSVFRPDISRTEEFAPGHALGNQAMLRRMNGGFASDMTARPSHSPLLKRQCSCGGSAPPGGECAECKAKKEAALKRQVGTPPVAASATPAPAASPAPAPAAAKATSENVWGLMVNQSMCGCKAGLKGQISWANTAASDYAACDVPANKTGTDVEACFKAREPSAVVVAETSSSGSISGASGANPCTLTTTGAACDRIENKATCVHETMHARHTDNIAQKQGAAFYAAWQKLAGDPDRTTKLKVTFPKEIAAFESQWNDGHDWAQDEIHSYTWQRRFLEDALSALNRIC